MPQGDLHKYAVDAEENLEKLATGLVEAGAPENVTKTVSQMADVTRKIVEELGKGQEQTGDKEPPAEEPAAEQQPKRETMDSATSSLHQEAQAAAARRRAEA